MQHAFVVGGGEAGAELAGHFEGLVLRQTADAFQQCREVLAIDVLHGKVGLTVDFAEVVDAADVGVGNLAGDADFTAEAVEGALVVDHFARQEFQCHGLAEDEIVGAIDLAHTSFAEQADNAIALGEEGAGRETAFVDGAGGGEGGDTGG